MDWKNIRIYRSNGNFPRDRQALKISSNRLQMDLQRNFNSLGSKSWENTEKRYFNVYS